MKHTLMISSRALFFDDDLSDKDEVDDDVDEKTDDEATGATG